MGPAPGFREERDRPGKPPPSYSVPSLRGGGGRYAPSAIPLHWRSGHIPPTLAGALYVKPSSIPGLGAIGLVIGLKWIGGNVTLECTASLRFPQTAFSRP